MPPNYPKQTHILGCKVDQLSKREVFSQLQNWMNQKQTRHIVTLNPEICLEGFKNDEYRKLLNKADLTTPDGIGLKYASFLLQTYVSERITGIALVNALCSIASSQKQSIYLIGGEGDTAKRAAERLKNKFADLNIAGAEPGPLKNQFTIEDPTHAETIAQSGAKVVFVAFGAPKQERWIQTHKEIFAKGTILIGVGGVFDYLAGNVPTPPKYFKQFGLEWLFRLFTQKGRLKRILSAIFKFPLIVLFWRIRLSTQYRKNAVAMIENSDKQILLVSPWWSKVEHWQFPQGGIDPGESSEKGILREMHEELGTNAFTIQAKKTKAHRYTWPWSYRLIRGYKGQKQDLFLLKFTGTDTDIDIETEGELSSYKWVNKSEVLKTLAQPRKELGKIALDFYKEREKLT